MKFFELHHTYFISFEYYGSVNKILINHVGRIYDSISKYRFRALEFLLCVIFFAQNILYLI